MMLEMMPEEDVGRSNGSGNETRMDYGKTILLLRLNDDLLLEHAGTRHMEATAN
jgi:hypothetical protein